MLEIRLSEEKDAPYLLKWLNDPEILKWFPMCDKREVDDAVRISMNYVREKAALTALWDKKPCGLAHLYLQPYEKIAHQALFVIIVAEDYRGRGIGRKLTEDLIKLGKEKFKLETLHLEVYMGNPAVFLYEKLGFVKYGLHKRFLKDGNKYYDKILMQKIL